MDAPYLGGILLQLAAFALVGFATGELILRWSGLLPSARESVEEGFHGERGEAAAGGFALIWVGITERVLTAFVGFGAFAVGSMAVNIVTRGLIFRTPGLVPLLALVVLVLWWRTRARLPRPRSASYFKLGALVLVAIALFAWPALVSGSSIRTGDPPWHLGWTAQLLGGEPVPEGPAPEAFARNAYPWGLHASMASMVRMVPGTDPLQSLDALHLALLVGVPAAAACLAFRLRKDSGWAAAAAATLIGGWGWISARGSDFVTSPRAARHGADMVVASPNSVYELFPPALPRELGVVLLGAAALFTMIGARNRYRRVELLAGFTAGLSGLFSVPMFVTAIAWMAVAGLAVKKDRRGFFKHTVLGAGLVFALWALPVLIDYIRFDGFVSITPRLGKEWPLHTSLMSWGLLLPLAVGGVWLAVRRRAVEDRLVLLFGTASVLLLLMSILRGAQDWDLWGNATLLHQGRIWPPLHLLAAAFAGPALMWLADRRKIGGVLAAAVLVVGAFSVVLSSRHLTEVMEGRAAGFTYSGPDFQDPDSFLRRAASHLGPGDVVALPEGDPAASLLGFRLFELSGARLVGYDNPVLPSNDLRVRYAELAARYERYAESPESADAVVEVGHHLFREGTDRGPLGEFEPTERGTFRGEDWVLIGELFTFVSRL